MGLLLSRISANCVYLYFSVCSEDKGDFITWKKPSECFRDVDDLEAKRHEVYSMPHLLVSLARMKIGKDTMMNLYQIFSLEICFACREKGSTD